MNMKEDLTLSVRAMFLSPIESMLLILGLALSIGATASGFGMFGKAVEDGKQMLKLSEFREIVVRPKESAEDMLQPLVETSEDDDFNLDFEDLDAKSVSPAISYSYISSRTRLRINTSALLERIANREQPPEVQAEPQTEQSAQPTSPADAGQAQAAQPQQSQPQDGRPPEPSLEDLATVEGPEPTVDELAGYEVSDEFFMAMNINAAQGSVFTAQDVANGSKLLVLGANVAATLYEDGEAVGRQIASFDRIYTIIGALEETGTVYDDMFFTPSELASDSTGAQAARGPTGGGNESLHFSVDDATQLESAEAQLTSWFDSIYGVGMVSISVPREEAEAIISRNEKIAIITLVLALAGLLIASVNVSNILYSRTLRRRKQIGILKALGATRRDVFTMFLSEGGLLLVVGAVFGIAIVLAFSQILSSANGEGSFNYLAVALGVLVSSIITLAFTVVPALQAAKVPPAEAMRVE
ncbi:ABC transporter permease [Reinekea marinisedimentorum]|uniref:ABC-type antimicrobial peptide transport system permease subunit n=1 Tax=Reinekea marinisedimentorum TaxID=230495 RepID=A0A4R3HT89_9GAMM|nr:FtsX-like permease family protein [Reinekea marinisedimentorum]TCS35693.1 ABC-type antimicrobial peptide transport system permease subunit [Reinekea marinisedimentorum]